MENTGEMIAVTGAAGFIGSNIVAELNARGETEIVAVDYFVPEGSGRGMFNNPAYLDTMQVVSRVEAAEFPRWLKTNGRDIDAIVHMGACTDTTRTDRKFIFSNNTEYTRTLWRWATNWGRPFVYASSAATYGDGRQGYDDRVNPAIYKPLNLYGESKHAFDLWAMEQADAPPRWAGMKYFNVYGPRESHKQRMASVAFHAFNQIQQTGQVRLFESHKEGCPNGGQKRDFVFVDDVVDMTLFLLNTPVTESAPNGLYNAGTGQARTFEDLGRAMFSACGLEPNIVYFPMPEELRGKYQYFTQATMEKLRAAGYSRKPRPIEDGLAKYVEFLKDTSR